VKALVDHPINLVKADGKRTQLKTDNKGEVHIASDAQSSKRRWPPPSSVTLAPMTAGIPICSKTRPTRAEA
jgi:hypothetical protein